MNIVGGGLITILLYSNLEVSGGTPPVLNDMLYEDSVTMIFEDSQIMEFEEG